MLKDTIIIDYYPLLPTKSQLINSVSIGINSYHLFQ